MNGKPIYITGKRLDIHLSLYPVGDGNMLILYVFLSLVFFPNCLRVQNHQAVSFGTIALRKTVVGRFGVTGLQGYSGHGLIVQLVVLNDLDRNCQQHLFRSKHGGNLL